MTTQTMSHSGRNRVEFWLVLILVILFVYGLATGMSTAIWRLSTSQMLPVGLSGILVGWLLAGIKRQKPILFVLGTILGTLLLMGAQSGLFSNLYRAVSEALKLQVDASPLRLYHLNPQLMLYHHYQALYNLNVYFWQLADWFRNLSAQSGAVNPDMINLIWGSGLWVSLFAMGWLLKHQTHTFLATLPALTLLAGVVGYTRRETPGLIIALGAMLGLVVLTELIMREHRWEVKGVDYSDEIRFDIITVSIPILAVIIISAGLIPQLTQIDFRALFDFQRRTESQMEIPSSLGLEQTPLDAISETTTPGLPRSHLVGSGSELSDVVIMEIDPGRYYVPPQIDPLSRLPKYYWFGRAYDVYTGSGWTTGEIRQERLAANQTIHSLDAPFLRTTQFVIRKTNTASPTLYFSGILTSVDQSISIEWLESTDEFLSAQLSALNYQVTTSIFAFPEEELRQADNNPPEIIQSTYLQLPPELPERVVQLAENLTQQADTPYQQAKLIEAYLRHFEYTLDLPLPPGDQDIVDHFLFDLQKGYCDYFASAMVVLARAAGLPARLAVGYAPGDYDYNRQVFVVVEANAHAWPEIYLEPFGWVPFEPTASLAPIAWAVGTENEPPVYAASPYETVDNQQLSVWRNQIIWFIIILIGIISALITTALLQRKKKRGSTRAQIESVYRLMQTNLARVFFEPDTEQTPHELYQTYATYLQPITLDGYQHKLSNQMITNLRIIIILYELATYSPQVLLSSQVDEARQNLFALRLRSLFFKLARLTRAA